MFLVRRAVPVFQVASLASLNLPMMNRLWEKYGPVTHPCPIYNGVYSALQQLPSVLLLMIGYKFQIPLITPTGFASGLSTVTTVALKWSFLVETPSGVRSLCISADGTSRLSIMPCVKKMGIKITIFSNCKVYTYHVLPATLNSFTAVLSITKIR